MVSPDSRFRFLVSPDSQIPRFQIHQIQITRLQIKITDYNKCFATTAPPGPNARSRPVKPVPLFRVLLRLCLCAFCACSLFSAGPAGAETINYPTDGTALQNIHGFANSLAPSAASPSNNSVTVTGGTIGTIGADGYVFGGWSYTPGMEVRGNRVSISGGTVGFGVYGGYSFNGNATGNSVSISGGGTVGQNVFGGYSDFDAATGNSVTLSGGTVGQNVYGGYSFNGNATGNSVTLGGGTVGQNVYGGRSGSGNATGNSVGMSGGSVGQSVYGGYSANSGNATGNSVNMSGGTVGRDVIGGFSFNGNAASNSVTLTGGTMSRNVFGGVSWTAGQAATNNTVTLAGPADVSASILFGGFVGNPFTLTPLAGDAVTGNTLNVRGFQGSVAGARNFQNYTLALPASYDPSRPLLTITGAEAVNLNNTNVAFEGGTLAGGGQALRAGQALILIDKTTGQPVSLTAAGRLMQGISLEYGYQLGAGNDLRATVTSVGVAPKAKSLSEGRLAGLAFVNQGYDLLIGQGMQSALFASGQQPGGLVPFAAFQGGSSRYDTGSHVDVDGFSLLTGLAWSRDFMPHKITLGAFFEGGWGNYDSHNSFDGFASVAGDGDTSYVGGGVLARWDLTGTAAKGLYVDASFRAGQVKNDFSSDDLRDGFGRKADYDSSSAYYGAHAGLGYIWSITDKASLDFSTRYIWTRQDSDSVTLSTGDPARFEAADSQRWRSGARFSYAVNEYITPYAGAYYDHEFDGKARATTYGYRIDAPDLAGGTGVGELGLTWKPVKDSGFSMDLGVQGYTGVREGVSGSLQLKLEF